MEAGNSEPVQPTAAVSAYALVDEAIGKLREAHRILSTDPQARSYTERDRVVRLSKLINSLIRLRDYL